MKDFRGTEIQKDDRVIWACRKGGDMWLSQGVVLDVRLNHIAVIRDGGKRVKLTNMNKLIVDASVRV